MRVATATQACCYVGARWCYPPPAPLRPRSGRLAGRWRGPRRRKRGTSALPSATDAPASSAHLAARSSLRRKMPPTYPPGRWPRWAKFSRPPTPRVGGVSIAPIFGKRNLFVDRGRALDSPPTPRVGGVPTAVRAFKRSSAAVQPGVAREVLSRLRPCALARAPPWMCVGRAQSLPHRSAMPLTLATWFSQAHCRRACA